ncbi:MAG: hypothetical protein Dbin4_02393 [Alphaproteobacteria bacterium]|jgi:hypothetical protein|nr:hypothetical protein [Alphaproteobacteria bacterium]
MTRASAKPKHKVTALDRAANHPGMIRLEADA